MARRVVIPYIVLADAGEEKTKDIYTVPPGNRLTIDRIVIIFPSGTNDYLEIDLRTGIEKVYPEHGFVMKGDGIKVDSKVDISVYSGSTISVHYKNNDTANPHKCYIIIEGVLE